MAVSFTDLVKPHLAVPPFDYSDAPGFVLVSPPERSRRLACRPGKCLHRAMPADFWLIFIFLAVVIPWRGRARLRHLMKVPSLGTREKLALYGVTIVSQWAALGIVAWRAFARGLTAAQLGLARQDSIRIIAVSVGGAVVLGSIHWFKLRQAGRVRQSSADVFRKLARVILPANSLEFLVYVALALTAGICEEFLYRGFAMAALSRAGLGIWEVVILTSILFGFAHAYQGISGIIGTSLMGFVFAGARLLVGSLAPVMVWHAAVDVVAGIAGPKYLVPADAIEKSQ